VHKLGGTLWVQSVENAWTTFTVDLPFKEAPVDKGTLSSTLDKTTILFVGCPEKERERIVNVFCSLSVDYECFKSLTELQDTSFLDSSDTLRKYIFLVHEDVYNRGVYGMLSWNRKATLLTFGPGFKVDESSQHFRSLTQILPSVLMFDIAQYAETCKTTAKVPPRRSSSASSGSSEHSSVSNLNNYQNLRCLIAEDNIINQKVLARILSRLGITQVEIVDNGAKAVAREAEESFDVIFMDRQMPVMSGLQATRLITSRSVDGSHAHAKVIFVTAHALGAHEKEAMDAGASGFLSKPCNIKRVEEFLSSLFL